jgi:hypothetical protein
MAREPVALLWASPAAETGLDRQSFKATRGEALELTFSRASGSKSITGHTITVRFAYGKDTARTSAKITATVSGTSFTAILDDDGDASTAEMAAGTWYWQAFDETDKELLSFGWMQLGENSDLSPGTAEPLNTIYQPRDALLTAIAALTTVADRLIYCTGADAVALTALTELGRTLIACSTQAAMRTAIGAGTSSFSGAFGDLSGTPTTLLGYGITDAASSSSLSTHIADTANPHAVTKTQVGLGNVDNTSDATKNAAAAALTNKTYNGLTISATTGTLTIANSKTLTASNTLTFSGTDGSSVAFGAGGTVVYTTGAETLTGKRITPRIASLASSATPSIDSDSYDAAEIAALADNITSISVTGTPTQGQTLRIALTGTATRTVAFGSAFEASTIALPTSVTTTRLDCVFVYNSATSKWRLIAITNNTAIVTLTGTQTLTNKTLTSPQINTPNLNTPRFVMGNATAWNGTGGTANTVVWFSITMDQADGSQGGVRVAWTPDSGTGVQGAAFLSGDPATNANQINLAGADGTPAITLKDGDDPWTGISFCVDGDGAAFMKLTSSLADPTGGTVSDGCVYYNTTTYKFRGLANGSWADLN